MRSLSLLMFFRGSESGPLSIRELSADPDANCFLLIKRYNMHRNTICKHVIQKIRDYLHNPDCLSPHRVEHRFVQKRSLSMLQVIQFLLYSSKASMYQNRKKYRVPLHIPCPVIPILFISFIRPFLFFMRHTLILSIISISIQLIYLILVCRQCPVIE